jgi:hypothetical protein
MRTGCHSHAMFPLQSVAKGREPRHASDGWCRESVRVVGGRELRVSGCGCNRAVFPLGNWPSYSTQNASAGAAESLMRPLEHLNLVRSRVCYIDFTNADLIRHGAAETFLLRLVVRGEAKAKLGLGHPDDIARRGVRRQGQSGNGEGNSAFSNHFSFLSLRGPLLSGRAICPRCS